MTLSSVPSGKKVSVVSLNTENGFPGRLLSLGLVPGTKIDVVSNSTGGACIVRCRGSRFIIGRELAGTIRVSE